MTTKRSRALGALVLFMSAVTACNTPAAASPSAPASPGATAQATDPPAASVPPTEAPASAPPPGGGSTGGSLEALVPGEVAGFQLTKRSMNGSELDTLSEMERGMMQATLGMVGASADGLEMTVALGATISITAIRVQGADPRALADAFVGAASQALGGADEISAETIAGKDVRRIKFADAGEAESFVTVSSGVVWLVGTIGDELVEPIFEAIP